MPIRWRDESRAAARTRLWLETFRALYGPQSGDGFPGLDPTGLPSADDLGTLTRAQLVARPATLLRKIGPAFEAGDWRTYGQNPEFRELVVAAARGLGGSPFGSYAEAVRAIRTHLARAPRVSKRELLSSVRLLERLLAPEKHLVIEPAVIRQKSGVSTISRHARFRADFAKLANLLNPQNWKKLGPYFDEIEVLAKNERSDGWDGLLREVFVVDWSCFRLYSYRTVLNIDFTYSELRVRTDFSLAWEEDDQLERDSGFMELTRIPGERSWCKYHAEKSLRFRSAPANIFAPMLMSAFLQSGLSTFEELTLNEAARR